MSVVYSAVSWTPEKKRYDAVLVLAVLLYVGAFVAAGAILCSQITAETLLIRALGTGAFLLLHVILAIGPLCRRDPRFLPLLYNRRHMGVTMCVLALGHGPLLDRPIPFARESESSCQPPGGEFSLWRARGIPFEVLGLAALAILFLMAATSHDFWLDTLTPRVWKRLHILVYVAYALLVGHVTLGVLQTERSPVLPAILGVGMATLIFLNVAAAQREAPADAAQEANDWIDAGDPASIPDNRARVVSIAGERVVVFRYGDRLSAISNVCRHQNGPLGEGRNLTSLCENRG
jgi:DMSO/TMAO reductase YedYZ heme-binding membrane subunit